MKSKFKIGDKVICVNNKYCSKTIEIGKKYTVVRIFYHSIILGELNQYVGHAKSDFEKIETIRRIKLRKLKNKINDKLGFKVHGTC